MPRRRIDRAPRPHSGAGRRDRRRREAVERWRVRGQIVSELRNIAALVRETAEALIAVTKASLLLLVLLAGPSAVTLLVFELLRSR